MKFEDVTQRLPTDDLFKKSYGVGHHYRPGYYFPDSSFESQLMKPVPPDVNKPDQVTPSKHFLTTYNDHHDPKFLTDSTRPDITYQKAPGHWVYNYNKSLRERLGKGGWRRPLDPAYQKTEVQDEFDNKAPLSQPVRWKSMQPFVLYDHHHEGPSKRVVATTANPKMASQVVFPKDMELLHELDPYVTTNMKYHRVWKPEEWNGVSKKDIPTYWDCEDYAKPHGFGMKHNPIKKDGGVRPRYPMRDNLPFEKDRKVRNVPPLKFAVPHSGHKSEYGDAYVQPADPNSKEAHSFCVDIPYHLPAPGPSSAFATPGMYKTEYMNIGKREPVLM